MKCGDIRMVKAKKSPDGSTLTLHYPKEQDGLAVMSQVTQAATTQEAPEGTTNSPWYAIVTVLLQPL